jgi:hypothetical protein
MKTAFHALFAIAMLLGLVSSVAAISIDSAGLWSSAACSRLYLRLFRRPIRLGRAADLPKLRQACVFPHALLGQSVRYWCELARPSQARRC